MNPRFDKLLFVDSAFGHGFGPDDFKEMLRNRPLVLRSRRGEKDVYEILGQSDGGDYLHAVGRMVSSEPMRFFRVFHLGRMHDRDRRRYKSRRGRTK